MRKNLGVKSYLYPMPVLIIASYDEAGKADAINAAWGSVCDSEKVGLYRSHKHKTVKNILARKAFTVSMADAAHVAEAGGCAHDYGASADAGVQAGELRCRIGVHDR